jgi:hypothetical protein
MIKREYGAVYFWKEARKDLFAAAPTASSLLKYVQISKY